MGQQQSKRNSNASTRSLLTTYTSEPNSPSTPLTPFEDITPPAKPQVLNRISQIIDPRELLRDEIYNVTPTRPKASSCPYLGTPPKPKVGMVHSPSGNALGTEEFIAHPSRPLAMWERQERVMQATREGMERLEAESRQGNRSRLGMLSRVGSRGDGFGDGDGDKARSGKGKQSRRCCWPF